MRFITFIALLLILTTAFAAVASETAGDLPADDVDSWVETCRDAMRKLGKALKAELQAAMAADGPVGALQTCSVEAVPITETISAEEGLLVGRTSLQVRNPANAPDAWEEAVLHRFDVRAKGDEKAGELEEWVIVADDDGHRTFRYMQSIAVMPMCLRCHGRKLDTEVAAKIGDLYPDDAALGYKAGDLRGAFTVQLPLD